MRRCNQHSLQDQVAYLRLLIAGLTLFILASAVGRITDPVSRWAVIGLTLAGTAVIGACVVRLLLAQPVTERTT